MEERGIELELRGERLKDVILSVLKMDTLAENQEKNKQVLEARKYKE